METEIYNMSIIVWNNKEFFQFMYGANGYHVYVCMHFMMYGWKP
jgi:hypothetical protein